jgi:hypothetical protein
MAEKCSRTMRRFLVLEGPTLAILASEEAIGFGAIGDFQGGAIPKDFPAEAQSHVAQQDDLRKRSGIAEVTARGLSPFAGLDPLPVMAG